MQAEPTTPDIVKDTVRRHWAGRAATFDEAPNHGLHNDAQRQAWLTLIQSWAGPTPLDALDVGCGTGFLSLQLATLGHRVAGLDGAAEMLDLARAKAAAAGLEIDFRLGDAESLPFAPASLDLIVERHVLWTLPDPAGALADWARALRPAGRLILIEGQGSGPGHADYAPIKGALPLFGGRSSAELTPLVLAAGLVNPRVEPLMDHVLWGRTLERERYALSATKPG